MSTNANPIIYLPPSLTSNQDAGPGVWKVGNGSTRFSNRLRPGPSGGHQPNGQYQRGPSSSTHLSLKLESHTTLWKPRAPPGYGYVQQAAYLVDRKVRWG